MGKILFQLDASFCLEMMFWSLKSGLWVCISNLFIISYDRLKRCDAKFSHKFQSCFVTAHIVASNTFHWNRVAEGFLLGFFWVVLNLTCLVPQSKESVVCWILYFVCLIKAQTVAEVFFKILSFHLHWSLYHLAVMQKYEAYSQICLDSKMFSGVSKDNCSEFC